MSESVSNDSIYKILILPVHLQEGSETSFSTSINIQSPNRVTSIIEESKQINFCWNNITVSAPGVKGRKGLCGKIGRREAKPGKQILENGKYVAFLKNELNTRKGHFHSFEVHFRF